MPSYNSYSRLTKQKLDGTTYASVTYDAFGRVQDIVYEQAKPAPTQSIATAPAVQSSSSGTASSGSLTLSKPTGTADGDLLVMTASADLDASENVTYTIPSGWTQLLASTRSDTTSAGTSLQAWYKIAASEPASYAVTPDHNNLIGGSISRISGHDPANPVDVSAATTSLTGEAATPSVTTTVDKTLLLSIATWDQSRTITTAPAGHTQSHYVDVSGHDNWSGYKEQSVAGATGMAQFDLSGSSPYVGLTVAVRPIPAIAHTPTPMKLTPTRDVLGRHSGSSYQLSNGAATHDDTVTRSQSGMVVDGTENGQNKSFAYDKAGRLTSATFGNTNYAYNYSAQDSTQCPQINANLSAYKNANRTSQIVDGVTTTYCYDHADRLIYSSDNKFTSPQYDAHGNMTQIGSTPNASNGSVQTKFGYDVTDRNTRIQEVAFNGTANITKQVDLMRDVQGRVTKRTHTPDTAVPTTFTETRYVFTGDGDSPDVLLNTSNQVQEKYLTLVGGVLLTLKPNEIQINDKKLYSLPNLHSSIFVSAKADGTVASIYRYDPFGNAQNGEAATSAPSNTANNSSFGWAGAHRKDTETAFAIRPIEMGARPYISQLGRFTQVDPVEGGTENNYVYPGDPINLQDFNGQMWGAILSGIGRVFQSAKSSLQSLASRVITKVNPKPPAPQPRPTITVAKPGIATNGTRTIHSVPNTSLNQAISRASGTPLKKEVYLHQIKSYGSSLEGSRPIMVDKVMADKRFPSTWQKYEHSYTLSDGTKLVAHWFENLLTGEITQVKLK